MSAKQSNKLNQRSRAFSLVLNDNELNLFKSSNNILKQIMISGTDWLFVAVCMHDKDFDNERHCYKTKHYHLVLSFGGVHQLESVIKLMVELFKCNQNQVSCEKCNSIPMQVRYMVHLDDFDKHRYDFADIVSNRDDIVNKYLHMNIKLVDVEDLYAVMREYPHLDDLIANIGLDNYKKWRVVIQDLRRDRY